MAGRSVNDLLAAKQIIGVVSTLRGPGTLLQDLWGMGIGGANNSPFSGRNFFFDTFDITRKLPVGRRPGAATGTTEPQKVGEVFGRFPRSAERIPLKDEDLMNRRRIGGPLNELDAGGEKYIMMQEAYLAQKFRNLREFQIAAMMRGNYYYTISGDDLYQSFTAGDVNINFQIPDGNKEQLDIIGVGDAISASWKLAGTDIPGDVHKINEYMIAKTGWPLEVIVCRSGVWLYMLNNTAVRNHAGSSNSPIASIQKDEWGNFEARLAPFPWVRIIILEGGLELGSAATYTNFIEADHAFFLPQPSPAIAEYLEGSEIVTEERNDTKAERFGFYAWADPTKDPSGWELKAIHNGIPALYNPNAICYGDTTA